MTLTVRLAKEVNYHLKTVGKETRAIMIDGIKIKTDDCEGHNIDSCVLFERDIGRIKFVPRN